MREYIIQSHGNILSECCVVVTVTGRLGDHIGGVLLLISRLVSGSRAARLRGSFPNSFLSRPILQGLTMS